MELDKRIKIENKLKLKDWNEKKKKKKKLKRIELKKCQNQME